jgi:rod shape-determining protein MreC
MGGDHMNRAIQEYVRREHMVLLDEHGVEELKRELGCALPLDPEQRLKVPGRELPQGKPVLVELGSHEIGRVLEPIVSAIIAEARLVVANITPELLRDIVHDGIVLTGGGAQLQGLRERLRTELRLPVTRAIDPQKAVIRGLSRLMTDATLRRALLRTPSETPVRARPRRHVKGWIAALLMLGLTASLTLYNFDRVRAMLPTPVDNALSKILTPAMAAASGASTHDAATRAALAERERQLQQLSNENQRLWKAVGHPPYRVPRHKPLVARVVGRDPRGWLSYLNLDTGSQAGVRKGMVVTTLDGSLVGRVVTVDNDSSRVRLFTDKGVAVAGSVKKTAGLLQGNGQRTLEMRYLDPDAKVRKGDVVTTSGQDGLYPAGLKVGVVKRMLPQSDDSFQSVQVDPANRFDTLREVTLLR